MVSTSLRMDDLRKIIIDHTRRLDKDEYARKCAESLKKHKLAPKSSKSSEKLRIEANRLYAQKNLNFVQLYEILTMYNGTIALAPNGSEALAVAYANKSAVLLRMRRYRNCVTEIDRAIKLTGSMNLRIKLLCRKAECLTALGSPENTRCLEKAKFTMTKIDDSEEVKLKLSKLIEKAQSVIDEGKLDIPKEERRKTQVSKMIDEVERRNVSESIRVEYSKKYRRHLVAARDYKPGEIILVEKPYFSNLNGLRTHQYCDRCFYHLWTAWPCDHCVRRLYCSEKCKVEAWNEHHELECSTTFFMIECFASKISWYMLFVTSVFCKALKEAGSIEQLVADSETSDHQCEGKATDKVSSIMDLTNYKSLLALPIFEPQKDNLVWCIERSIAELISLAKNTTIVGRTYDITEIKKLMKNDTAILVGALLLKFNIILRGLSPSAQLVDPNEGKNRSKEAVPDIEDSENRCLPLIILHTLRGCIPNVDCFATHGNKFILCAIRPIKAGEQLILMPKSKTIWHNATTSDRQLSHKQMYGVTCDCQACVEDWSDFFFDAMKYAVSVAREMHCPKTLELWIQRNSILDDWKANYLRPNFPDVRILSRAVSLVTAAWEQLKMPSALMHSSVEILIKVLQALHDPSEIYVKVPHLRTQTIGIIYDPKDCPPKDDFFFKLIA